MIPLNESSAPLHPEMAAAIAAGDECAFRQLYKAFYGKLVQFSSAITRNPEAAEEIVEDV